MSKKTPERTIYKALRTRYLFYMSMLCAVIILLGGVCALLLALSIALSAVKFLPGMPAIPAPGLYAWSRAAPVAILDNHNGEPPIPALRLPSCPIPAPSTNPASLFTHLPDTPGSAKIRRTILLPPKQDDEAPGERAGAIKNIGRRPTGLLARYGQSQQQ